MNLVASTVVVSQVNNILEKEDNKMTNEMIIAFAKEELANEGILKFTGNTITVFDPKTEAEIEIPEVEDIHTCAGWNKRGFKLIKGTTCEIKFKIWTYKKGKKKVEGETEEEVL